MSIRSQNTLARQRRTSLGMSAVVLLAATTPLITALPVTAGKFNRVLSVGDSAPVWNDLKCVDGQAVALRDFEDASAVVLVFFSNRCPMSQAYTERLIELTNRNASRGVKVVAVSIGHAPADAFEAMQLRAKERKYPFFYAQDLSQEIGRKYGATCTPHAFLIDGNFRIAYMGAIDDAPMKPANVEERYLQNVIDAVLSGTAPEIAETRQTGCEIEYRDEK